MSTVMMLALMAQDPTATAPAEEAPAPTETTAPDTPAQTADGPSEGAQDAPQEQATPAVAAGPVQPRLAIPPRDNEDRGASLYSDHDNRWNSHQVGDLVTVMVFEVSPAVKVNVPVVAV